MQAQQLAVLGYRFHHQLAGLHPLPQRVEQLTERAGWVDHLVVELGLARVARHAAAADQQRQFARGVVRQGHGDGAHHGPLAVRLQPQVHVGGVARRHRLALQHRLPQGGRLLAAVQPHGDAHVADVRRGVLVGGQHGQRAGRHQCGAVGDVSGVVHLLYDVHPAAVLQADLPRHVRVARRGGAQRAVEQLQGGGGHEDGIEPLVGGYLEGVDRVARHALEAQRDPHRAGFGAQHAADGRGPVLLDDPQHARTYVGQLERHLEAGEDARDVGRHERQGGLTEAQEGVAERQDAAIFHRGHRAHGGHLHVTADERHGDGAARHQFVILRPTGRRRSARLHGQEAQARVLEERLQQARGALVGARQEYGGCHGHGGAVTGHVSNEGSGAVRRAHVRYGGNQRHGVIRLGEDVADGAQQCVATFRVNVDGAAAHAGRHAAAGLDEGAAGTHEHQREAVAGAVLHAEHLHVEALQAVAGRGRHAVAAVAHHHVVHGQLQHGGALRRRGAGHQQRE